MTTPDTTGAGNGKATPSVKPGANAFHLVSDMESQTSAIRDLAYAIIMASSGADEVNPDVGQSALIRLGWQLVEQCETLEAKRCGAFAQLHGVILTPAKVQS